MEALHKPGVAIDASVRAACIAVEGVITNTGMIQQAFAGHLTDNHSFYGGGPALLETVVMLEQALLLMSRHGHESQELD